MTHNFFNRLFWMQHHEIVPTLFCSSLLWADLADISYGLLYFYLNCILASLSGYMSDNNMTESLKLWHRCKSLTVFCINSEKFLDYTKATESQHHFEKIRQITCHLYFKNLQFNQPATVNEKNQIQSPNWKWTSNLVNQKSKFSF